MHRVRRENRGITLPAVFIVTLVSAWVCVAKFVDHNTYIVRTDGTRILKDRATVTDRVVGGAIWSFPFAVVATGLSWAWVRLRQTRSGTHGHITPMA